MSAGSRNWKVNKEEARQLLAGYRENPTAEIQAQLVSHYRSLVESLAVKFARGQDSMEDLVQVGMIGLLASFRRYDPEYGYGFESFAIPTIVGEIKRYIRDKTWSVHVPRRIKERTPQLKRTVDELTIVLQRSPQIAEIAQKMGITEEEVLETMEMGRSYHALSIDVELDADQDGGTITLLDQIGEVDGGYHQIEQTLMLGKVLTQLSEREKEIIQLTFYDNLSQKQVGDLLGISQMHVSRLQRRALAKLRVALHNEEKQIGGRKREQG
ncbi:RNA polymerase sigma factor SigB [Brevibacillus fulvus]|uniref:RNA polymerase sigma-B factor n=1 Tax=Brevibacillus fulvus TaxID=1125967 RepID=A0A938Y4S2_9BACL|nr:RNA polymerase sigma factor SigB [Brevibacillus fulvus]MBM7591582.1 RNA polymerase sigma-B factor [Brevibacillus fulvus]